MRALLFVGFALVVLVAAWWLTPGDPAAAIRANHSPVADVKRTPAPELGLGMERWVMYDRRGAVSKALWRPAPDAGPGTWTVVMLGGLETGDRAALLLDGVSGVNVLAVDWPWDGPRRARGSAPKAAT